jgi:uncharacterized protein YaeQ
METDEALMLRLLLFLDLHVVEEIARTRAVSSKLNHS